MTKILTGHPDASQLGVCNNHVPVPVLFLFTRNTKTDELVGAVPTKSMCFSCGMLIHLPDHIIQAILGEEENKEESIGKRSPGKKPNAPMEAGQAVKETAEANSKAR